MFFDLGERLTHAYNAFRSRSPTYNNYMGVGTSIRPDRTSYGYVSSEKSIIDPILNRMAIDIASLDYRHVRVDNEGLYESTYNTAFNRVLTLDANVDQTSQALFIDIATSMFDEGDIAVVPIETSIDPSKSASYEIYSMRVGRVLEYYPEHVRVSLYDERIGRRQELTLPKREVALVENPLYSIMNKPNSTLKRLVKKLNLLDTIDDQNGSGKMDLIIQLPYTIKHDLKKKEADERIKDIEMQLSGSKLGVAYIDGTEKVTQLNRPVLNNVNEQVQYLTRMLHNQLGMTESIFNGTASEEEMLNYYTRTIEPCVDSIVSEFNRKFITKTGYTQGQRVLATRDPFKLLTMTKLSEVVDSLSRNEIMSSNEFRSVIGRRPKDDDRANQLVNKNINQVNDDENKIRSLTKKIKDLEGGNK